MPRDFYYPTEDHQRMAFDELQCEVVRYTTAKGKFCAMAFAGKASKPAWHHSFYNVAAGESYIAEWLKGRREALARKAQRTAERKAWRHTLKVGDILHSSWGYDQTNCDYYEVVALVGQHMVEIREISSTPVEGSEGFMSDRRIPTPGQYCGEPMRKRVTEGNRVTIKSYAHAWPWDGKANYCSWYA